MDYGSSSGQIEFARQTVEVLSDLNKMRNLLWMTLEERRGRGKFIFSTNTNDLERAGL